MILGPFSSAGVFFSAGDPPFGSAERTGRNKNVKAHYTHIYSYIYPFSKSISSMHFLCLSHTNQLLPTAGPIYSLGPFSDSKVSSLTACSFSL